MNIKNRIFYLIIEEKNCGKFSGEKPIEVAKKIANKKLNKITEIIYYLKEIGGKNKRYGPYHAHKDKNTNKITVSTLKKNNIMKGGYSEINKQIMINNYFFAINEPYDKQYNPLKKTIFFFRIDLLIKIIYEKLQGFIISYPNNLNGIPPLPDINNANILALDLNNYCTSSFCSAGVYNYNEAEPNFRGRNSRLLKYRDRDITKNGNSSGSLIHIYQYFSGKDISKYCDKNKTTEFDQFRIDDFYTNGKYSHFLFIIDQGIGKQSIYLFVKIEIIQKGNKNSNNYFNFINKEINEKYDKEKEHDIDLEIIVYGIGKENFYNFLINNIKDYLDIKKYLLIPIESIPQNKKESYLKFQEDYNYTKYYGTICFKLLNFLENTNNENFSKLHTFFINKKLSNQVRIQLKPEDFLEEIKLNKNRYNKCIKKNQSCVGRCYKCDKLFPFKNLTPEITST